MPAPERQVETVNMSDAKAENTNNDVVDDSVKEQSGEPTPVKGKRQGTKRLSTLEKTAQEGAALIKDLDNTGEMEGRRRTRSAAKGIVNAPTPPKKEKKETPARAGGRGRGRPKKSEESESNNKSGKNDIKKMEVDENSADEKVDSKDDKDNGSVESEEKADKEEKNGDAKAESNSVGDNDIDAKDKDDDVDSKNIESTAKAENSSSEAATEEKKE